MRRTAVVAAAGLLLGLVACGDDDDDLAADQPATGGGHVEYDAENYDIAYTVCELVLNGEATHDSIDVDPATRPAAFAEEYASGYRDDFRQAPYDGCLDALEGRDKRPPG
jgi:hypothetical protein